MTAARKLRRLGEMYPQEEIDRAAAYVNRVYINAPYDRHENPVVGWGDFAEGFDELERYIEPAIRAVLARRWYAVNGPQDRDLQPLPLGYDEREDTKRQSCAGRILGWYARSVASFKYDISQHPSLYDYACGILALEHRGSQLLEQLKHRFPPRLLAGLDRTTANWSPPWTVQKMGNHVAP